MHGDSPLHMGHEDFLMAFYTWTMGQYFSSGEEAGLVQYTISGENQNEISAHAVYSQYEISLL